MRHPAAACAILAFAAGCAAEPPKKPRAPAPIAEAQAETPAGAAGAARTAAETPAPEKPNAVAFAEAPWDCADLAAALADTRAKKAAADAAHDATRAANFGASFLGLIPGVGLAALAVKAGTKTATLASKEARRSPAEEHALNQARWEVMGCEGEEM